MRPDLVFELHLPPRTLRHENPHLAEASSDAELGRDLEAHEDAPAIIERDGRVHTYSEIAAGADVLGRQLEGTPDLVLIQADNSLPSVLAYLAALRRRFPVMLLPTTPPERLTEIKRRYHVAYEFDARTPSPRFQSLRRDSSPSSLHCDLALVLSTSGSTGTPKMVRLSRRNLVANARSIAEYLRLGPADRAITSLPLSYSYGLSVLNSHLFVGGSVVLTDRSVVDPEFWELAERMRTTCFAGVPYTYELLNASDLFDSIPTSMRQLTQAGGRLSRELVLEVAKRASARGCEFFVMYGQTEATARMAYLPPDKVLQNPELIGRAIPGGEFRLIDEAGREVRDVNVPGELVYTGPNVMMGYAEDRDDLLKGAELQCLHTGDIAVQTSAGMYAIKGRKSRFLKIRGSRIALDELERHLAERGFRAICGGTDACVVVVTLDSDACDAIRDEVSRYLQVAPRNVRVVGRKEYPMLPSGKVDMRVLKELASPSGLTERIREALLRRFRVLAQLTGARRANTDDTAGIDQIFCMVLRIARASRSATFASLGGDSLSYVEMSVALEDRLGHLPRGWEHLSIAELEAIVPRRHWAMELSTDVPLRAAAIVGVVAGHVKVTDAIHGGSMLLFMLVGTNLARFQLPAMVSGDVWRPVSKYATRLLIPYWLTVFPYLLWKRSSDVGTVLLFGNLVSVQSMALFPVWFVQVALQCVVILGGLLSIPAVREFARRRTWAAAATLFATSEAARYALAHYIPMDHLYNRVPHQYLPVLMVGVLMQLANTNTRRAIVTAALAMLAFRQTGSTAAWVLLGGSAVVWIHRVRLPTILGRVTSVIAAASLYIFMLHMVFVGILHAAHVHRPLLALAAAMLGSIGAWSGSEWLIVALLQQRRRRDSIPTAAPGPAWTT